MRCSVSPSESFLPRLRIPAEVHYCGDDYHVTFHSIEQPARKAARPTATMVLTYWGPGLGVEQDATHRAFDLVQELQP